MTADIKEVARRQLAEEGVAGKGQHLIAADDHIVRPASRHIERLRLSQMPGNSRRGFPQVFGLDRPLVDLRWTRLESKAGPGEKGLSGGAGGSKN